MTTPKRPDAGSFRKATRAACGSDADYFLTLLAERNVRVDAEIEAIATEAKREREFVTNTIDLLSASMARQLAELDRRLEQRFALEKELTTESLNAVQTAIRVALEAADKASSKAETATEKRFDSVNEFRAQLKDQATTFIPRVEAEQRISQLSLRIEELRSSDAMRTGRSAGSNSLYGWIIGGVSALAAIIVIATTLLR